MFKVIFKWILFSCGCISFSEGQCQAKIVASITGLRNDKGVCRACLFTSAASFAGDGAPYKCSTVGVRSKMAEVSFTDVPAGTYAMSVFHDSNNNNAMDKNFLGIPKEGYGASGNKLPFAAAPVFKDNKFVVAINTTTHLRIRIRNL
jgi:uncharacterized protein (DUF2141 family)